MKKNVKKDVTFFQLVQPFYPYFYLCGSWFVLIRNTDQDPQSCRKRIQFRSGSKLPLTVSAVFVKKTWPSAHLLSIFLFSCCSPCIFFVSIVLLCFISFFIPTQCRAWAGGEPDAVPELAWPRHPWRPRGVCGVCGRGAGDAGQGAPTSTHHRTLQRWHWWALPSYPMFLLLAAPDLLLPLWNLIEFSLLGTYVHF